MRIWDENAILQVIEEVKIWFDKNLLWGKSGWEKFESSSDHGTNFNSCRSLIAAIWTPAIRIWSDAHFGSPKFFEPASVGSVFVVVFAKLSPGLAYVN